MSFSQNANYVFRWAVGDYDPIGLSQLSISDRIWRYSMSKMSILSFQKRFPGAKFAVIYNGTSGLRLFVDEFRKISPDLIDDVTYFHARDYELQYHFKPEPGVWWKWVPFRLNIHKTEIYVDSDIICLSEPHSLKLHLGLNHKVIVISDILPYFCEEVCGNLWKDPILYDRIPLNCGFLVLKPGVTFEKEFIEATKRVIFAELTEPGFVAGGYGPHIYGPQVCGPPPANSYSHFLDEQGCFNIGLYKSDIPFALLTRGACIYGQEMNTRLKKQQSITVGADEEPIPTTIEMCHFIGKTKQLYFQMESQIFRSIFDKNYRIDPAPIEYKTAEILYRGIRIPQESL